MDVVFLADHLGLGGAETQLIRIATTLSKRGLKVGVIALLPSRDCELDFESNGISYFECSSATVGLEIHSLFIAFRLIRQLMRWHPKVLITFNYHADVLGRLCGWIAGVPKIVASLRTAFVKTSFRKSVYRRSEWMVDLTVSNSHAAISYMLAGDVLTPSKTMVIPNGIITTTLPMPIAGMEARAQLSWPPDTFVWLAVGNLRPAKDYGTLLKAVERCASCQREFVVMIAGDGDEKQALADELDRLGLRDRVWFLGSRTDVPLLLRACDAFVLSSAWEGMPNTVMEAMASGVPVVSTNAGGVRELVLEGVSGFIVPIRDPEALGERMLHMMSMDEAGRVKMGESGRARIAQCFDNERVVDRWEVMIHQMIKAIPQAPSHRESSSIEETPASAAGGPSLNGQPPGFIISLDFELMWGMRDKRTIATYGDHVLGERAAIPAMLMLFKRYEVKATWAAVGMTLFERRSDLLSHLPERRPTYTRSRLNPYSALEEVGVDEKHDPYHFGSSLVQQILACDGMELGSHTFSHYYCLEKGQDSTQFKADLEACVEASDRFSVRPTSFVFPRNQYNFEYLSVCSDLGFTVFRGNEGSWMYEESMEEDQSSYRRAARLADNYFNITGDHGFIPRRFLDCGMINCPSSRFLRPFSANLSGIEWLRVRRIQQAMEAAARKGQSFHLWWHPHNFGTNLGENLSILEDLLRFHVSLRERYGVVPMTMGDAGRLALEAGV